jgi:ABC-2 type transport system ATP-binding protein
MYNHFIAVDRVSLTIHKWEIYGFIGLNGAGKTTTIRMLLNMIRPTQGACFIKGQKIGRTSQQIWQDVGYMVETPYAYPELTVKENIEIIATLRRITCANAIPMVMEQLSLTRYATKKARNLSLGNAQRLGIAKALLHRPDILILDEPVNGLDPAGIVEIRNLLQHIAKNEGVTILISSHLLSEVAKISTTIGIIHEGKLLQEVKTIDLQQQLKSRLIIETQNNTAARNILQAGGYHATRNQKGQIELTDSSALQAPEEVSRLLVQKDFPPTKLRMKEEDLESYFLRLIKKNGG